MSLKECERKVNAIRSDLPEGIRDPQFEKFDIGSFPIMTIAASSSIPSTEFFDLIDNNLKTQLSQIQGVAKVEIIGGTEREIEVKGNADKLKQYGLSLNNILQVIGASNIDFPTGKVKDDKTKSIVRLSGKFNDLEQIRNLVITKAKDDAVIS